MSLSIDRENRLQRASYLTATSALLLLIGCSAVVRVGVRPFYWPAALDPAAGEVLRDLRYRDDRDADAEKHRLDLYRPQQAGWPVMVFAHGGGLNKGDKDLRVGGYDIYGNIGRFYAAHGIGVAVINYRLQPEVRWPEQADDVAASVAWAVRHAPQHGGDGRVFLAGHSVGAWLVALVARGRVGRAAAG